MIEIPDDMEECPVCGEPCYPNEICTYDRQFMCFDCAEDAEAEDYDDDDWDDDDYLDEDW